MLHSLREGSETANLNFPAHLGMLYISVYIVYIQVKHYENTDQQSKRAAHL